MMTLYIVIFIIIIINSLYITIIIIIIINSLHIIIINSHILIPH